LVWGFTGWQLSKISNRGSAIANNDGDCPYKNCSLPKKSLLNPKNAGFSQKIATEL